MKARTAELSVLMFCPQYYPRVGGTERQADLLSRALVRRGVRVRILTPRFDSCSPEIEFHEGVEIVRFRFTDLSALTPLRGISLINVPSIYWQVRTAVRSSMRGFDVLHAHSGSLLSALAVCAAATEGMPTLCKLATSNPIELGAIRQIPLWGSWVQSRFLASASGLVAVSYQVANELARLRVDDARVAMIPNGVAIPPPQRPRTKVRRFLYLGRVSRDSNRDLTTLIGAFSKLAESFCDVELALVGGGDLLDLTKELVAGSGAGARIHVPGFGDPRRWIDWADAFVLPSRIEGMSNALLEAMASGLPCIANDIPANREALGGGKAGVLCPVGDQVALLAAMRALYEDRKQSIILGRSARTRAEAVYSIDIIAEQYGKVYRELIVRGLDEESR